MSDVWGDERPTRRQLAFDLGTGLAFAALMGVLHGTIGLAAGIAAALVGCALAVRRLSWRAMSVAALGGALLQVVSGQVAYLADGGYAVLFFTLGAHRSAGVRRWGLGCAAVATVVAGGFQAVRTRPTGTVLTTVALSAGFAALAAVVTGGGWVAGLVQWQNRQAVQARVDAQLEAAERRRLVDLYDVEQERRRIAADMHDVVAHSWAVVAAQSDGARYGLPHDPAGAERALELIGETARTAISDLRTIVAQLRDPTLAPSTPGSTQQAEVLARMRASGMDLQLRELGERDASPLLALTAHRLLGEALTNALKHGDLTAPVEVEQDWTDGYRLTVTNRLPDDPSGAAQAEPRHGPFDAAGTEPREDRLGAAQAQPQDGVWGGPAGGVQEAPAATARGTGHGLVGMAERTTVAGGTFHAGAQGREWVLRARVPRPSAAPARTDRAGADS